MVFVASALLIAAAIVPGGDGVGLVDPANATWYLTSDGDDTTSFVYGNPGDVPLTGDWDCDGVDTPGMYRRSDGYVYLRNSNSQGVADVRFFFGNPGDVPLTGDFDGDGCDTVSVHRPSTGQVFVIDELGADDGGLGAATVSYHFGNPDDAAFTGDFDGDGTDTVGLHRPSTGFVYFRNRHAAGVADQEFYFGDPGDRLLAGDWGIVDGIDTPAVFRPGTAEFLFRHTNSAGNAESSLRYGNGTLLPVAGVFGSLPGGDPPPPTSQLLHIVSRDQWGAVPPDAAGLVPHIVERLTVHHAGDQSAATGSPRYQSWQAFHMRRGWPDISYHYIVGVDGTVYEGRDPRYRTDTNTGYDTTGHLQIVLEGNFQIDHPSEAQLDALAQVLAWASVAFDVSPDTIAGHRDHGATACPGEHLAGHLDSGEIRTAVEALIAAGGVSVER